MLPSITATGASKQAVHEVYNSLTALLGEVCHIEQHTAMELQVLPPADAYACGISVIDFVVNVVPREKIIITEPRFTSEFFLKIAKLPEDATVHIFHSSRHRIDMMIQGFRTLGFDKMTFIPVTNTMPAEHVEKLLCNAKYIVGTEPFLRDVLLGDATYSKMPPPGVTIISGKRVSSLDTYRRLIDWCTGRYQKKINDEINRLVKKAKSPEELQTLSKYRERCMTIISDLTKASSLAYLNQISPDLQKADGQPVDKQVKAQLLNLRNLYEELEKL